MKKFILPFVISMTIWIVFFSTGWWLAPSELTPGDMNVLVTLTGTISLANFDLKTIITNNSRVIIQIGFGLITAGITTIVSLIINGFTIGGVFGFIFKSGFSVSQILRVTLPHSLELVGIWLAASVGLQGIPYALRVVIRGQYPSCQQLICNLTVLAASMVMIWVAAVLEYKISMGR